MYGPFASKLATAVAAGGIPRISVKGVLKEVINQVVCQNRNLYVVLLILFMVLRYL